MANAMNLLREFWPHLLGLMVTATTLAASIHIILHKRDTRAATAWMGIVWLAPFLGTLAYILLGINRIERSAQRRRSRRSRLGTPSSTCDLTEEALAEALAGERKHLRELVTLVGAITKARLVHGNRIDPLVDGVETYPAMLEAIDAAEKSISLCSYIFSPDTTGRQFVDALGRAVARGVQVRVLVDAIGANYAWPTVFRFLKEANVPAAAFMRTLVPAWFAYANLRSHRKLLVVDGRVGFTGGMNIREPLDMRVAKASSIHDLHARFEGPVVGHLQHCFAEDWEFATGERLTGKLWFPTVEPAGAVLARGVPSGPDEDMDKIRQTLLGALACSDHSVKIVTPYFLPDDPLMAALNTAAMRGVTVDVVLPAENNLSLVQWASTAQLWQILDSGCRVWLSPPPFDHTKLMLVDDVWSFIGSTNWDPRSLRLNFEFNVECYDAELCGKLTQHVDRRMVNARRVTRKMIDSRPLPIKLRDGLVRLFSPYL